MRFVNTVPASTECIFLSLLLLPHAGMYEFPVSYFVHVHNAVCISCVHQVYRPKPSQFSSEFLGLTMQ